MRPREPLERAQHVAPAVPRSALATLIAAAPRPTAASRYRPSGVMVRLSRVPGQRDQAHHGGRQ